MDGIWAHDVKQVDLILRETMCYISCVTIHIYIYAYYMTVEGDYEYGERDLNGEWGKR